MGATRLNFSLWFARVLGWDGILPLCVVLVPFALDAVLPDAANAICVLAVVLPIAALLVRVGIGRRAVAGNRVGPVTHFCQWIAFACATLVLFLVDALVILLHLAPAGTIPAADLFAVAAGYGLYVLGMVFAMYPGRTAAPVREPEEPAAHDYVN